VSGKSQNLKAATSPSLHSSRQRSRQEASIRHPLSEPNPMSTELYAIQHIRRMRGGSQSHLMRASDGHFFVVKFQN
jgi:hypothetical protein